MVETNPQGLFILPCPANMSTKEDNCCISIAIKANLIVLNLTIGVQCSTFFLTFYYFSSITKLSFVPNMGNIDQLVDLVKIMP